ncbi:MAG TPA: Holliday junction branch migration protein RuvA, partial [Clostridiales bacterium]|nr:Holliday junction branch migration protein RuvA [Clostridiales bacterium]
PPRSVTDPPQVTLYTHLAVREDDIELYGFATQAELSSFRLLLTVSGVGPKAALAVLSLLSPEKFALAVCTDDRKTIS